MRALARAARLSLLLFWGTALLSGLPQAVAGMERTGPLQVVSGRIVESILMQAGLKPRVRVYENGNSPNMIECLFWKNGEKVYLGLVKNPTMGKEKTRIGKVQGITGEETEIRIEFQNEVELVDWGTKRSLGKGRVFRDRFRPWEGNLYQVTS